MDCIAGEISVRLESTGKPVRRKFVSDPIFLQGNLRKQSWPLWSEPHAEQFRVGLTPHEMKNPSAQCSERKGPALEVLETEGYDGLHRHLVPKLHRTWVVRCG